MATLNPFTPHKRLVLKIGSALLVDAQTGRLRSDWLSALALDISKLKQAGADIVLVSSGAIALGRNRLGLLTPPLSLPEKQAAAAAGQSLLTQAYEKVLAPYGIVTAQALLTLNDTEDRQRWLNARLALTTLLRLGAIPVINENDTVATDEIRYGDNDRLAARTAQMLGADTLILFSDIDGLYTSDPRQNPDAKHIPIVEQLTPEIMAMGGKANAAANVGTGGMATKLAAAQISIEAGCHMCIVNGLPPSPIQRILDGERCTWFKAVANPVDARRQWIKGSLRTQGTLTLDPGAVRALYNGKSLLAAGITACKGAFSKGDAVLVHDENGVEIARGLIAYDAEDVKRLAGKKSGDIYDILGYDNGSAIIHRDNMVLSKI